MIGLRSLAALTLSSIAFLSGCGRERLIVPDLGRGLPQSEPIRRQQRCDSLGVFYADVDGDKKVDRVYHEEVLPYGSEDPRNFEPRLGVCTAAGDGWDIDGAGMTELAGVIDIEPDGKDEIIYGGTSVCAGFASLALWAGGRLHQVFDEQGDEVFLVDSEACSNPANVAGWGCKDVDRDGKRELVTVELKNGRYQRRAYKIVGAQARLVSQGRGPASRGDLQALRSGSCRSLTHVPDYDRCRAANEFVWAFNSALLSKSPIRVDVVRSEREWRTKLRVFKSKVASMDEKGAIDVLATATTGRGRLWTTGQRAAFEELARNIRDECGFQILRYAVFDAGHLPR